jgi:alpha-1,3-mannosyl-glycoprotein beta-1,2-N-acetylglucosaminyltransferase
VRQVQKHIGVKTQSPDKTTTRDVNPVKENNVVTIHNGPAVENKREGNTPDVVEVAGKKPSISPVAVNEIDIKTVTQAHNLKANAITKQSKTNLKGNESVGPDDVLPVLVLSCDRTSVKRCLDLLIKYRPSVEHHPIIVSQDCGHEPTAAVIQSYGNQIKHIRQPDLSSNFDAKTRALIGYYKIARHYKWALTQVFDVMKYKAAILVEDDLDIAVDFFEYFTATRAILQKDPSLWCVSAWNDNGKQNFVDSSKPDLLYRSDFFPGLGWMLTSSLWDELKDKWPAASAS